MVSILKPKKDSMKSKIAKHFIREHSSFYQMEDCYVSSLFDLQEAFRISDRMLDSCRIATIFGTLKEDFEIKASLALTSIPWKAGDKIKVDFIAFFPTRVDSTIDGNRPVKLFALVNDRLKVVIRNPRIDSFLRYLEFPLEALVDQEASISWKE